MTVHAKSTWMKIVAFCVVGALAAPRAAAAAATTGKDAPGGKVVSLEKLPASRADFDTLRGKLGGKPEGTAALFVTAMLMLEKDSKLGLACALTVLSDSHRDATGGPTAGCKSLVKRFAANPRIARSYVLGTEPAKGYALPKPPLRMSFSENPYSRMKDGSLKLFAACSGADSPRPVRLKKNAAGAWKVISAGSLSVGVKSK